MRSGTLDKTITLQRVVTINDEYGAPQEAWTTFATRRAQRVKLGTEEFLRAFGNEAETVAIFRMRYLDDLNLADRLQCEGETFDIKSIEPIGRRKALELRCVVRGAS